MSLCRMLATVTTAAVVAAVVAAAAVAAVVVVCKRLRIFNTHQIHPRTAHSFRCMHVFGCIYSTAMLTCYIMQ